MPEVAVGHLRELLASTLPDPVLVLVEGRVRVEPRDTETPGAGDVISRAGLRGRPGAATESTDRDLELIAATLTTAVVQRWS
ncbi:hypothetical protein [Amycolatopsis sp. FDAARGOS 1241]|uniref:hypothetical protein n=1 Tax=Amycolatopsis sp. FDAARGOS 1241 TaxID=2778070 RepID=UPI00194E3FD3|nr:hypothetical protein [Amycolatopsis sp. FDAARGOS 1241]QRP50090.1 hypothetical protein I6J71_21670 [Amycolatopsis sp. FDAARGOS 1241]